MLTDYITAHTVMLPYMMYPKFLLTVPLSETSKLVYIMLLDRARLSIVNADYSDSQGRIFVYYPLDDIAADIDRSRTTVKKSTYRVGGQQTNFASTSRHRTGEPDICKNPS